jgi:hypothetical protein
VGICEVLAEGKEARIGTVCWYVGTVGTDVGEAWGLTWCRYAEYASRRGVLAVDEQVEESEISGVYMLGEEGGARVVSLGCRIRSGAVANRRVSRLVMVACREVLVKKQSGYKDVIAWLEGRINALAAEKGLDYRGLARVVERSP